MKIENEAIAKLRVPTDRQLAERDIVLNNLRREHQEVDIKRLSAIMPFFTERTIKLALYALKEQGQIDIRIQKGHAGQQMWYKAR